MPTHKILCDLDVGGEVKGTSLDINGAANIDGLLDVNTGGTNTVAIFESTDDKAFIKVKDNDTDVHLIAKDNLFSIGESSSDYDNFKVDITSGNTTVAGTFTAGSSITGTSGTFSGDINANGNIVGDDGTNITNIATITADVYAADADSTTKMQTNSTSIEFLVADSDVMDLNETTLNVSGTLVAKKHKLAITSSTDGNADGDIVYFGSTTSMDTGKIYYLNSSGAWALADADAESTAKGMLGVALGSASNTNGVLIRGMVTLDHDPGTQGDTLFLSTTAGTASSTAPSGNGDIVRVIGYCLNSSNGQVYFNPDGTFVEVTA